MSVSTEAREFWREVIAAGGSTGVPRWTLDPKPGAATYEAALPPDRAAALGRLAASVGVSRATTLLAAHAMVLSTLSGEDDVTSGYVVAEDQAPLPCRLSLVGDTWRELLKAAHRAAASLLAYRELPLDDLRRELGLAGPSWQTELDPSGDVDQLAEGSVLRVGFVESDGLLWLRLRYRTDAFDDDAAARIAGYHLAALEQMIADPDAEHFHADLVSAEERRLQTEEFAGRRHELPDRRVHELFEERVRTHPDAVAAVCGTRFWTYRELNSRANRIARALLARGLDREGVVGVATERNLHWMAAVLAVFKAGGAYLPIEPHFAPDRIAAMISRSGCRLIVTEADSTDSLDRALESPAGVEVLRVDAAYEATVVDHDLGIPAGPDQLAYIYFTSGSTGEPKGAMCEHAGFLNHVYAKIEDLEIGPGQVVAQTAPQCFDISLWQLVSALLVGGRTLILEQDTILDVERFVDRVVTGRVTILQVVPSYLDIVLSHLEREPRDLPDLHFVSVTGEALPWGLTRRWFEAQPGIRLVNAYGLTETSDDTNHEILDRAPEQHRVPLGRPVANVHVYVVDERLRPVPLGASGEIVFSGVCVGRGYVNDAERTLAAFIPDPLRQGQRCYRSGDIGRWRPDGKLEFLGRRDSQVKIAGFRIEIGEVESALARVPGIGQSSVVVADGQRPHLIGFYSGQQLAPQDIADRLRESLPAYMIPTELHWRAELPLTANGKVDRSTLAALAGQLDPVDDRPAPSTAGEQRLAAAWAEVLNVATDQIGRHDDFYERGGTSLAALQLVIALGRAVSLEEVRSHPVLADLARLVDAADRGRPTPLIAALNYEGRDSRCPSPQQPR